MAGCNVLLLAHGDIPGATGATPCPHGETPSPLPGCPEGGQMSPGCKQRLPGDGEQSQALRPRSAGAAFGLHCSPRAEETAWSQPGPFPGQRRPVCVRAAP